MNDIKLIWLVLITLATIAQALLLALKLLRDKASKNLGSGPAGKEENPSHGERIATLETEVKNIRRENEQAHNLIRLDIRKLFNCFNGLRK